MERPLHSLTLQLVDADATTRAGAALAPTLRGGMVVTLQGELGSGKTTLVRGLLRERGVTGPIKSPSYALVEHYPLSNIYFYHIDLYRFADPDEWETAGLAECFRSDAVCLIEWPERMSALLPAADVTLALALSADGGRTLTAAGRSESGERCVDALASTFKVSRAAR